MTVEEMLERMSLAELMHWAAFLSGKYKMQDKSQIMNNLKTALAGVRNRNAT